MPRVLVLSVLALAPGCGEVSCLKGEQGCIVEPACTEVSFACEDARAAAVWVVREGDDPVLTGHNALVSPGDIVLANDRVTAVISAVDHPHFIAPTGGTLIDLATTGDDNDSLRDIFHAAGLLPTEAFHYVTLEIVEETPDVVAVQASGTLDGYLDVAVFTRYELHRCDPGIRVRSEMVNRTLDPLSLWLVDAFYWGGRENLSFAPGEGMGFVHPPFGLTTIKDGMRHVPYMVAAVHEEPAAGYTTVSCVDDSVLGIQSEEISAMGTPPRIVQPRDYEVFERFVAVSKGPSVARGADIALEVRKQLFDDPYVTLEGRVRVEDDAADDLSTVIRANVLVSEVGGGPWTHVVPEADGTWEARVPAGRSYAIDVEAFGQPAGTATVAAGSSGTTDAGEIEIPAVGALTISATVDGVPDHVLVHLVPADVETEADVSGTLLGHFMECAPLLGNPFGGAPACNRVLVYDPTTVLVPPGNYDLYATAGLFSTLAHVGPVHVDGSTAESVQLDITTLPELAPEGVLSGDFHVHGGASFDSSIPELDRVKAFLAARVDVIASTEHDVVWDYAEARKELGAKGRMELLVGVETTGHILFPLLPSSIYPKVIGHWNAWPLEFDPEGPWRGAPWDEQVEPGELFDRLVGAGFPDETGVLQLNHPWGGLQFGRDFGWTTALELDLTQPLSNDITVGNGIFGRTPEGANHANSDYDVQEVMNSTSNAVFQQYRAIWFYLLNQGVLRGGTANSDSHTLGDEVLGTPRNLVFADMTLDAFRPDDFNLAVRKGRILGTNGPILLVKTTDSDGDDRTPSVEVFEPADDALLDIEVHAPPWVPVDEVRIYVNGELAETLDDLDDPEDPFGTEGTARLTTSIPLADLLPDDGDAWIVVEAGAPLEPNEDLDCNGVPDTGDNNRDGTIDWRDVLDLEEDPEVDCFEDVGPLTEPIEPQRETPAWHFRAVTPKGYPAAFTNPLILDRDGGGYSGVGP